MNPAEQQLCDCIRDSLNAFNGRLPLEPLEICLIRIRLYTPKAYKALGEQFKVSGDRGEQLEELSKAIKRNYFEGKA